MESKNIKELEEELKRLKLENQILEESNRFKENAQPHVKKSGWLNEFFWWCAGVDKEIIRQCPTDHAKYVGIGGTILFTALMAMLSAGYALSTVFDNLYAAIGFGIFWGLLIFNLDRFIVNTMYSDGEAKISWQEFKSGLPRIIMAIFLGVVISTPLELKIFEDGIDIKIEQKKDALLKEKISDVRHEKDSIEALRLVVLSGAMHDSIYTGATIHQQQTIANLEAQKSKLEHDRDEQERLRNEKERSINEFKTKMWTYYRRGTHQDSVRAIDISRNTIPNLSREKGKLDSEISRLDMVIRNIENQINTSRGNITANDSIRMAEIRNEAERLQIYADLLRDKMDSATIKHVGPEWPEERLKKEGSFRDLLDLEYKGFEARMDAFSEMKEEPESSARIASLFIMLLFIIIETAPTFFKMMTEDGPYDHLKQAKMAAAKALAVKIESQANDDVNTELSISQAKNEKRLEAELKANEDVMDKIASVQSELLKTSLELWRETELKKIQEDPTSYVKTN